MAALKKIACPKCQAKLKFDSDKITAEVVKFKCPGCQTVIRLKKPGPDQDILSPQTPEIPKPAKDLTSQEAESKPLDHVEQPALPEGSISEKTKPVETPEKEIAAESAISEKPDDDSLKDEQAPLPPEDQIAASEKPEDSLLEEYTKDKLAQYEEGEAEAGDLEWTRYADKKEIKLPKSNIDLDLIPVTDTGLHETLADLQEAEIYNLQGEANLEKNFVKQAIRDFNHALEINPDYVDALVNRGSAHVLQNSYNEAIKDLNHALDLEKKQAGIYNIRGEIYLLNKMLEPAIKDFTAAIILNPTFSDAYLNRARAYSEKGMKEEADTDYQQVVKGEPDKFSGFIELDDSESLFYDEETSNREKAADYIQHGLENLKNEKWHEAIENFTEAINLSANEALGYILRGQVYVELRQADEAMVDLNRAVIYDPLNPALYYWRAMAWKLLDSKINIVSDLKLACELGYEPACSEYESHKPQKH